MDLKGKRILFIVHEDSCTGAPIAMLGNIRILAEFEGLKPDICVLNRRGGLHNEFSVSASNLFSPTVSNSIFTRVYNRAFSTNRHRRKFLRALAGYDVVVLNSIVSLTSFGVDELKQFPATALFLYEMPLAMASMLGNEPQKLSEVDLFLVPSKNLLGSLRQHPHVRSPVAQVNQFIGKENLNIPPVRQENNSGTFTVGMIGSPVWPKAFEYFLCIAKLFATMWPDLPVRFVWKGVQQSPLYLAIYTEDIRKAGLGDRVTLEPNSEHVNEFYESIDLLALTSREDTYPNVMIEAALFEKPTICFADTGGAESFVTGFGGIVVPFLDLMGFSDTVRRYYLDPALLRTHGQAAKDFALANHCDKSLIFQQLKAGLMVWDDEKNSDD